MKKSFALSIFVSAAIIFASCKKKESDPAPSSTTTPAVNQPSATAPSLNSGASTTLSVYTGSANEGFLNLVGLVSDPQGDDWSVTSVTSSNTAVATVEINGDGSGVMYTGVSAGTVTITIVVTDENGNANTLTYTLTVSQAPNAPTLNANTNTNLSVQDGSSAFWNLSDKVTDPQGDSWTVTSVASSNTAVATVSIDGNQSIAYLGVSAGTATMTVTVSDGTNASTFTATINVAPKIIIIGPGGGPK